MSQHSNDGADDRLHDVDSAAAYLHCGRRLIYRLVQQRRIAFTYAGRFLRFRQSDLDAYLDAGTVHPVDFVYPSSAPARRRSARRAG